MGICGSSEKHSGVGPRFMPGYLTGKEWFRLTYRSKKIAQDTRHGNFIIEREEFPLSRFYSKWGGMVLAKSPDFQNEIKSSTPDNISRIHFSDVRFCVENGEVAHKIGKEMMSKNVEANVGGVFIHRNKECELVLEGYEASLHSISHKINEQKETSEFQLLGSENPKKRAYTVLSDYSVSRLGVANQPEMKLHSISETKEVSHTALRVLIREMEDQLQFNISTSKLKMRRAIIDDDKQEHGQKNRSNSGVAESNTNSLPDTEAKAEERVLKVHKKNFVFKNRPLGFRIEVAGKGDLPKSNIYRYVCIPTTNTGVLAVFFQFSH
eukprot:jgi/Bigna1/91967/estExt_fgenesh1_pg.C_1390007